MHMRTMARCLLILLAAVCAIGCSSTDVGGTRGGGAAAAAGTGTVVLRFELLPRIQVPGFVTHFRIVGKDANGNVIYPAGGIPFVTPKQADVTLGGVPTGVKTLCVEFLRNGVVVGTRMVSVTVPDGGLLEIDTIPFTPANVTDGQVTPADATIAVGASQQYTAVLVITNPDGSTTTSDISDVVRWASSNPGVASISSTGLAAGVSPGQTRISATLNYFGVDITRDTGLTVTGGAGNFISIDLQPATASRSVGGTVVYTCTGTRPDGSIVDVSGLCTYTSSNTGVCTLAGTTGTAVAPGTSTITASLTGTALTDTATFTCTFPVLGVLQGAPPSCAYFNFDGATFNPLGAANVTLPDTPLYGLITPSGQNAFIALNQTGVQVCQLDPNSGQYFTTTLLGDPNCAGFNTLVCSQDGSQVYGWNCNARRFCSMGFDGTNLNLEHVVVFNTPDFFGTEFCSDSTFNFCYGPNLTQNCIFGLNPGVLDPDDFLNVAGVKFIDATQPTVLDDDGDTLYVLNRASIPAISGLTCSSSQVYACSQGAPGFPPPAGDLFGFNVGAGGMLNPFAGNPFPLINSSFPGRLTVDREGGRLYMLSVNSIFDPQITTVVINPSGGFTLGSVLATGVDTHFVFNSFNNVLYTLSSVTPSVQLNAFLVNQTNLPTFLNSIPVDFSSSTFFSSP
ncbi:MAG: Ig-like domain-containing protein [Candidatus Eremiobacterota bacterium]